MATHGSYEFGAAPEDCIDVGDRSWNPNARLNGPTDEFHSKGLMLRANGVHFAAWAAPTSPIRRPSWSTDARTG
jgi:hypothetical protein